MLNGGLAENVPIQRLLCERRGGFKVAQKALRLRCRGGLHSLTKSREVTRQRPQPHKNANAILRMAWPFIHFLPRPRPRPVFGVAFGVAEAFALGPPSPPLDADAAPVLSRNPVSGWKFLRTTSMSLSDGLGGGANSEKHCQLLDFTSGVLLRPKRPVRHTWHMKHVPVPQLLYHLLQGIELGQLFPWPPPG